MIEGGILRRLNTVVVNIFAVFVYLFFSPIYAQKSPDPNTTIEISNSENCSESPKNSSNFKCLNFIPNDDVCSLSLQKKVQKGSLVLDRGDHIYFFDQSPEMVSLYEPDSYELLLVLGQFCPHKNPRYAPVRYSGSSYLHTFCNIFIFDTSLALGAEIPHWVYQDQTPARPGSYGSRELTAEATIRWLFDQENTLNSQWGRVFSRPSDTKLSDAIKFKIVQSLANRGIPVLITWSGFNFGLAGHMAWVVPGYEADVKEGPMITQAGRLNFGVLEPTRTIHGFFFKRPNAHAHMKELEFWTMNKFEQAVNSSILGLQ